MAKVTVVGVKPREIPICELCPEVTPQPATRVVTVSFDVAAGAQSRLVELDCCVSCAQDPFGEASQGE